MENLNLIKIKYIGNNIASKIICAKYPEKAFVYNAVSKILLDRHDIKPIGKMSITQKYDYLNNEVHSIAREVGVRNMIAMDYIFYRLVDLKWDEYWSYYKKWTIDKDYPVTNKISSMVGHALNIKSDNSLKLYINANKRSKPSSIYVSIDFTGPKSKTNFDLFVEKNKKQLYSLFIDDIIEFDRKGDTGQALIRIRKYVPIFDRTDWPNQFEWLYNVSKQIFKKYFQRL